MNGIDELFPRPEPEGETPVSDEPAFASACMSIISQDAARLGWRLGKGILTHSDVWGCVFRIDFQVRGQARDSKLINRIICWGTADGTTLGTATVFSRKIEPL